jgi:hypothetical protein
MLRSSLRPSGPRKRVGDVPPLTPALSPRGEGVSFTLLPAPGCRRQGGGSSCLLAALPAVGSETVATRLDVDCYSWYNSNVVQTVDFVCQTDERERGFN